MSSELAEMLKEIESVIRKYRLRLEQGVTDSPGNRTAEYKRFRILDYVARNQSVTSEELYSLAEEIGMQRQGLGGFFRTAVVKHVDETPFESAMLKRENSTRYARIYLERYGDIELERLGYRFRSDQ